MRLDVPGLVVALSLYAALSAWFLSDWRVRSLRSVALLLLGLATVFVWAALFDDWPLRLVGMALAGVITYPVTARSRSVMPLDSSDAEHALLVARVERRLVLAARQLKAEAISIDEYRKRLERARKDVTPQRVVDPGWRSLMVKIHEEISDSIAQASGGRRSSDFRAQRVAIRDEFRALVRSRTRFWAGPELSRREWSAAAAVAALVVALLLFGYLVERWTDSEACPGLLALDPTCIRISD